MIKLYSDFHLDYLGFIMISYAVIMAGGTGTRLWPLSRLEKPKQTHALIGERTMFQNTVDMISPLFGFERILVVSEESQTSLLARQLPEIPADNYIIEPEGRGTAPCIGLAAIHIWRRDPNAVMVVVTADHYIKDVEGFQRVLKAAMEIAEKGHLVTLGIPPTHPSTGFGYIEHGEKLYEAYGSPVFRVNGFTEKPDQDSAIQMVKRGGYYWNSGIFIWRISGIMEEFRLQMPDLYNNLTRIGEAIGSSTYDEILDDTWSGVGKQTIDYGVMEGAADVVVIPSEIGWSDIGSWSSLASLLPGDENENVVVGDHIGLGTSGSLIFGGRRLIATIGLEDMVVVDTDDALLVCPKRHDQKVREIVDMLKQGGRQDFI